MITYSPKDISKIISFYKLSKYANNKGVYYYNVATAFDIETSSFYRDRKGKIYTYSKDLPQRVEKLATMYVWQFCFNEFVIIGRTWSEFVTLINDISKLLQLSEKQRLIVYIHNLGYEFQFMRKLFDWHEVFAIDVHKPLYAITSNFIEFRCSYYLSGLSLGDLARKINVPNLEKTELDYLKIRHSKTELTEGEKPYIYNDVRIITSYINKLLQREKYITKIPLTKTGYVRKYCKNRCFFTTDKNGKKTQNYAYRQQIKKLQINDLQEFNTLQRAFKGGFVNANEKYINTTLENVSSYDITSSYPSIMVTEMLPMSKGVCINVSRETEFYELLKKYFCVFDIEFTNIFSKNTTDYPLQKNKCFLCENVAYNNNRVIGATKLATTLTNIDFDIIKNFYSWEKIRVGVCYCYAKGYLPKPLIDSILHLFREKEKYKNNSEKVTEYEKAKELLNSIYGMAVTNPLQDVITYSNSTDWKIEELTDEQKTEILTNYNNSKNRFLFYVWGVFVTAYARRNIFTIIHELHDDYVYSDTDCIKLLNPKKYAILFQNYNKIATYKVNQLCARFNLPNENLSNLGAFVLEDNYLRFKTLGAKRYLCECKKDGKSEYILKVAGLNKYKTIPYLIDKYGSKKIFDAFTDYLNIPYYATANTLNTYINYETSGEICDYKGQKSDFHELSAINIEPTDYNINLGVIFLNYILGQKFVMK